MFVVQGLPEKKKKKRKRKPFSVYELAFSSWQSTQPEHQDLSYTVSYDSVIASLEVMSHGKFFSHDKR